MNYVASHIDDWTKLAGDAVVSSTTSLGVEREVQSSSTISTLSSGETEMQTNDSHAIGVMHLLLGIALGSGG